MNDHIIGKKLIGKGHFSKVYDNEDGTVTIISDCQQKECFSMYSTSEYTLFPKVDLIDYNHNDKRVYKMKKYEKVRAPKKQLKEKDYLFYKYLKDNFNFLYCKSVYDGYSVLYDQFETIPKQFKKYKKQLLSMLNNLADFDSDIGFEISPRNIALDSKNRLILLDCFFFKSKLKFNTGN